MTKMQFLWLSTTALAATPVMAEPIVVTATGVEQSISETGASISVLTAEDIAERQSEQLGSILNDLPGVNFDSTGGVGTLGSVRIRGGESKHTLVVIDGVRVNDPSSPGGSFDFGNLLTGNLSRVEILRGANSVAWGGSAIGGVVLIETAIPTDRPSIAAQAEYGYRDTVNLSANAAGTVGPIGLAIGGGYFDTDGISAFSGGTERDGYEQYRANGRLTFNVTDAIRFDASGWYADSHLENDSVFPGFSTDSLVAAGDTEEIYGQAGVEVDLLDGALRNRLQFSIADINRDTVSDFGTSFFRGRSERFSYRGDWQAHSMLRLVFGAETEESHYRDANNIASTGIDSAYFQAVVEPVEGLNLTGGIRYDDHEDFGDNTSLSADLAWAFAGSDGPIFRAGYREGFRAPSLVDLSTDDALLGNPDLRPETAKLYEVSLSDSWLDNRWTGSIALFQRDVKDEIGFVSDCGTIALSDRPAICDVRLADANPFNDGTTFNNQRTRVRGMEIATRLQPVDQLHFAANYTYLDTEDRAGDNQGNRLRRRPEHQLFAELGWTPDFGLKLFADVTVVGDSFENAPNTLPLDGYSIVGLRASMPVYNGLEIYGRVENLFDVEYQTVFDAGTYGRSAYVGLRGRF